MTVVSVPTVRDSDGLALSSRNSYLTQQERAAAVIVPQALDEAERLYLAGLRDPAALERAVRDFIGREPLATAEVVAVRDPLTLRPLDTIGDSPVLLALFIRIGSTRLLDNRVIGPSNDDSKEAA